MPRRRRRRTSIVEEIFELGSSGFYGAAATCALGLILPLLLDWVTSTSRGNMLIDALAAGVRQGVLPYAYIVGLLVSGISIMAMIYFAFNELRDRDAMW